MATVTLDYTPRPYQVPFWEYMSGGGLRAVLVWHRRAGKDLSVWNWTIMAALQRVGTYHYLLPKASQARKVVWNGMDRNGKTFRSYVPPEIVTGTHDTDMRIHLVNGSIIQLAGSDNFDTLVGTNPVGVVLSEYALQDPLAWQFYSPILNENKGWAVFDYTPRGKNHGWKLFENAQKLPTWYVSRLSIADTGVLKDSDLDEDRTLGIPEEIIQQEYYCSFETTNVGAFFGRDIMKARSEGRVRDDIIWQPTEPVHTSWDFGIADATTIWFWQMQRGRLVAIDYYESHSQGLPYYIKYLQSLPYIYGVHLAPHDVRVTDYGSGITRLESAASLGLHFTPVPKLAKQDQINAGHLLLRTCAISTDRAERGLSCLENYEREWDDANQTFMTKPKHNWASHGADAFLVAAVGHAELTSSPSQFDDATGERRTHYEDFKV